MTFARATIAAGLLTLAGLAHISSASAQDMMGRRGAGIRFLPPGFTPQPPRFR